MYFVGNRGNGIHLEGTETVVSDSEFQDFCETKCIRCEVEESEFPLYFTIRKDGRGINCEAVSDHKYHSNGLGCYLAHGGIGIHLGD